PAHSTPARRAARASPNPVPTPNPLLPLQDEPTTGTTEIEPANSEPNLSRAKRGPILDETSPEPIPQRLPLAEETTEPPTMQGRRGVEEKEEGLREQRRTRIAGEGTTASLNYLVRVWVIWAREKRPTLSTAHLSFFRFFFFPAMAHLTPLFYI
ncbi:Unknown protein, partial [Striga hermonthica]